MLLERETLLTVQDLNRTVERYEDVIQTQLAFIESGKRSQESLDRRSIIRHSRKAKSHTPAGQPDWKISDRFFAEEDYRESLKVFGIDETNIYEMDKLVDATYMFQDVLEEERDQATAAFEASRQRGRETAVDANPCLPLIRERGRRLRS